MLRGATDLPVYAQGDDQLPTLVQAFADDEAACLVGTLSLWQGVDVPGRTCRLVVIDRIPFPRPDDPVVQARTDAVVAAGGNGFMSVSATHAALLLAQGAGRLIRRGQDRGVVAVLDSRLRTARYGGFLTRSMPRPVADDEARRGPCRPRAPGRAARCPGGGVNLPAGPFGMCPSGVSARRLGVSGARAPAVLPSRSH